MTAVGTRRPPGWFAENYRRDTELLGTPGRRLVAVIVITLLVIYPFVSQSVWITFACTAATSVITVVGLQILMGSCGQVNIGQSAFMGVGAYGAAYVAVKHGWPVLAAVLFAGIVTTVAGLIFALPATRIRGFYLALTTIAAQYVFVFAVPILPVSWLGGQNGLALSPPRIFGVTLGTPLRLYFLIIPVAAVLVVIASFINASQLGRQMVAVRENELAAAITGVHVVRTKIIAFGIASFYAGIAGALLANLNGLADYEQFSLTQSIWFLAFLVVGGIATVFGAVLGTLILSLVEQELNNLAPQFSQIPFLSGLGANVVFPMVSVIFGILIILILVFQPRGLAYAFSSLSQRLRQWPLG
jgi:branched-chain amino acid transport system permease protein